MSDNPTRELPQESFQARVLAEFAAIRGELAGIRTDIATLNGRQERFEDWLMALEEKVDSRLQETRPIWEAVQYAIKRLDPKFDIVLEDLFEVRGNDRSQDKRIMGLEAR